VEDDDGEDDGATSQFEGNRDDATAGHLGSTATARAVQMAEAVRKGGGFGGGTGGSGEGGAAIQKMQRTVFLRRDLRPPTWDAEMGRTTARAGVRRWGGRRRPWAAPVERVSACRWR
jgi:hypothetical protein